ncbi:GNAT family N-acetyltransferase [Mesorhizobium sp. YC-39]|uniref:GNAT family N-acetyltransferase n=1 Tax=unclassified Mesorhizobium TaxID=325217 RepID=UPI0021E7812F|nr:MULTISPECIES: GNAT family N-acetyltransferase [unclassified Mesorhizobium]MCV3210640.1 GNAT family N-acetyltransferase [Mesorhizobium sp. YC-2]MCV3232462.1 GNAT family N-acetyltransferase [Mesorhizobium sp. YC-39]
MNFALIIEPLDGSHDRKAFNCGVLALDRYIREQASQDVKRRVGNCFVAVDRNAGAIAGYYTLAASSIPVASLPEDQAKRLPHYPILPAILIGRLAVDTRYQGQRIGSALIVDALRRSISAAPASFALIVDAKDDQAVAFYRKHGFTPFQSRPLSLFLPIATALKLFD